MCACDIYSSLAQSNVTDSVLEVVAYEARRLFRDRLVSSKDLHTFDNILSSIVRGDWGSDALDNMTGMRPLISPTYTFIEITHIQNNITLKQEHIYLRLSAWCNSCQHSCKNESNIWLALFFDSSALMAVPQLMICSGMTWSNVFKCLRLSTYSLFTHW